MGRRAESCGNRRNQGDVLDGIGPCMRLVGHKGGWHAAAVTQHEEQEPNCRGHLVEWADDGPGIVMDGRVVWDGTTFYDTPAEAPVVGSDD